MAWLRYLDVQCEMSGCRSTAKVEVLGTRNQSYGKFCRRCGDRKLKQVQAQEEKG